MLQGPKQVNISYLTQWLVNQIKLNITQTVFVNYPTKFTKKATYGHEAIFINSTKQFQNAHVNK